MEFIKTEIPEVVLLKPFVFGDERGFFLETFRKDEFSQHCSGLPFVQDNYSRSCRGVLRGLHYQVRQPQGKLVRVVAGEIYDVAVDLRRHSVSFGCWVGTQLSAENKHQLWVPPGFAHGFLVLSENAEVLYKATDYYAPQWERTLLWSDPRLGITWPLERDQEPIISAKDAAGMLLEKAETYE